MSNSDMEKEKIDPRGTTARKNGCKDNIKQPKAANEKDESSVVRNPVF